MVLMSAEEAKAIEIQKDKKKPIYLIISERPCHYNIHPNEIIRISGYMSENEIIKFVRMVKSDKGK